MGVVFLIVAGGILGWLSAIVIRDETRSDLVRNIGIGIAGALLTGLVINPLAGGRSILNGSYSAGALALSLLGSMLLLIIVNVSRHHAQARSGR